MNLKELMAKANEGYSDGFLATYYDENTGIPIPGSGDGLAEFIVNELFESFDPDAPDLNQVEVAINAMENAISDIQSVIGTLRRNG